MADLSAHAGPQESSLESAHLRSRRGPFRVAVLASHVIQYQDPLFKFVAAAPEIDLTVFYCSEQGMRAYRDEGFGEEFKWDRPVLEGYRARFLSNWSPRPNPSRFWGIVNPAIVGELRKGRFDALWVHGWAAASNWIAMEAAFLLGIPVLMRGESSLLQPVGRWKGRVKRRLLGALFRRIAGFLAIGRRNAEFYRAFGASGEKIFHAPYAVDNDFFIAEAEALAPRRAEFRRTLGLDPDHPVVLFSGKLIPQKRPMDLLKAFAEVVRGCPASLLFVGDGALRGELEQYVRSASVPGVHIAGFRNQSELPKFYAAADIFVLPSGFERWGLVVNEAMCFGLPVIASDQVGAAADLVREGENGFVFPAGKVDELARRIAQLLEDRDLRARMGESSRRIIDSWGYREDLAALIESLRHVSA